MYWFKDSNTKPFAIAISICALLLVVFVVWFAVLPIGKTYPMTTKVVGIDKAHDIVILEDANGNLWEYEGCEDWEEGDIASLLMNDKGTATIYDDEIVMIRYNGTFEGWN